MKKLLLTPRCPASLLFQAMSACCRWSWEQTITLHGPMSLTVRANRVRTLAINMSEKGLVCAFDVDVVPLYLRPAEIELSCLIESISTTNPRIEWKKITNEGPSYVYFERKISGNTPNPQLFHCVDMIHLISIISYSYRWPGEQSCNQRTCHALDNQCHEIRYGQVSLWGHRRWWSEVLWWDCDWPCGERYVVAPAWSDDATCVFQVKVKWILTCP